MAPERRIDLVLLDIPAMAARLEAVAMELQDASLPYLTGITATTDLKVAFTGVDVALMVGARPRGKGMQRADLLAANAPIFEAQGRALDEHASRDVKVLVVGNPGADGPQLPAPPRFD